MFSLEERSGVRCMLRKKGCKILLYMQWTSIRLDAICLFLFDRSIPSKDYPKRFKLIKSSSYVFLPYTFLLEHKVLQSFALENQEKIEGCKIKIHRSKNPIVPHDIGGPPKVVEQQYIVVGFSILSFFFFLSKPAPSRGCTHVSQLRCISSIGFSSVGKSLAANVGAELHPLWRLENRRANKKRLSLATLQEAEGPFCCL